MKRYVKEYFSVDDKDGFKILLRVLYRIKDRTSDRRFYDLRMAYGPLSEIPTKNRRIIVKYFEIFLESTDRKSFILKAIKEYPHLKRETFKRYYDYYEKHVIGKTPNYSGTKYKKKEPIVPELILKKPKKQKYLLHEKLEPSRLKVLDLKDMFRYGYILDRDFLMKHGFKDMEVNWLIDEGWPING